jgi:hypothetical protein
MRTSLLAVHIDRRHITMAFMDGLKVTKLWTRRLLDNNQASLVVEEVLARIMADHKPDAAVLDEVTDGETKSTMLRNQISDFLRREGVPVSYVSRSALVGAFGHPALKSRRELRHVILKMIPDLDMSGFPETILDAAALGILQQVSKLISINTSDTKWLDHSHTLEAKIALPPE